MNKHVKAYLATVKRVKEGKENDKRRAKKAKELNSCYLAYMRNRSK